MYGDTSRIQPGTMEGYSELVYRRGRARALHNILRNWEPDVRSLSEVIARVKQPVMLIWGDRDRAVELSSASQLQHRHYRRLSFKCLPGRGIYL